MFPLVILYVLIVAIILVYKNCSRPPKFPPGPIFLPFIGTWYTLPPIGAAAKVPKWRKRYGNIIGHKIFTDYLVFITGVEEIVNGLKHPNFQERQNAEFFRSRTRMKKLGFFNTHGEQFNEVRNFTLRYLGQVFNGKLEDIMRDRMTELFSRIRSGSVCMINQKLLTFSLHAILELLVNVKNDEFPREIDTIQDLTQKSFSKGRSTAIEMVWSWFGRFFYVDLHFRSVNYIHQFMQERLAEHRRTFDENVTRDYVDAYLHQQMKEKQFADTQHYTDEELFVCLSDMIQASSESISNTAEFILLYVALNPEVQKKIHHELDTTIKDEKPALVDKHRLQYCEAVIKEAFRLNTIAPIGAGHVAAANTEFYGYHFPKGTSIFFAHDDMFKNAELWKEPSEFRPERFINGETNIKLTNFGLGKRSCVAIVLSKNMLFLFVTYFFQKYSIRLPPGEENPSTEPILGFTNGCRPFKLIITERMKKYD